MEMDNVSILESIDSKIHGILNDIENDQDFFLPTYIPQKFSKKILVLSGGGIRGISFIGALHALHELNILQNMQTFAGTSVGSLILFLYIIGYKPIDLLEFIKAFDLNKLKSISVSLFLESYGLDSGDKIVKTLVKFLDTQNIKHDITFIELFNKTNKTFIVTSVNVSEQKAEYFSHRTHPTMSVVQAIRMSISIPFVFTPVQFNNCLYVDGGCIDNFPLKQFSGNVDELIGVYIVNNNEDKKNIRSFDEYAMNVINSMINGITNASIENYEKYIIGIDIGSISSINFDITSEMKTFMYDAGYKAVHKYINKKLIEQM
jgi:NTE family protein